MLMDHMAEIDDLDGCAIQMVVEGLKGEGIVRDDPSDAPPHHRAGNLDGQRLESLLGCMSPSNLGVGALRVSLRIQRLQETVAVDDLEERSQVRK